MPNRQFCCKQRPHRDVSVRLNDVCQERRRRIYAEIKAEDSDYLLNANEDDLVEHYLAKLRFEPIIMYPDQKLISGREALVPGEWFPGDFDVSRGVSYTKYVVTYHVPYTGDTKLLKLQTNSHSGYSVRAKLCKGTVDFDIVDFYQKPESVQRSADQLFNKLDGLCNGSKVEVEAYNRDVEKDVRASVQQRKGPLGKQFEGVLAHCRMLLGWSGAGRSSSAPC